MNNKPLYLLNWLANVGLTDHLESQAPGALDILQRSANDFIGIVDALSKITGTEKSEGLEDFLNEIKVATTYLRPLMESSKADRLTAGSFYFDNLNGAHPVQSIEQVWSRNVSIPTPQPTLDIHGVNQLVGGCPFDTGVADMTGLKGVGEKEDAEKVEETPPAQSPAPVAEPMPEPPAEITLEEPLALADVLDWVEGCDLTIPHEKAATKYINELPTKAVTGVNPVVQIERVSNQYKLYTRNKKTGEIEFSTKVGKGALRDILANIAPKADAKLLAKVGRHIQEGMRMHKKTKIVTHGIGLNYVYVIVTDENDKVDFTYFTTMGKLAAYLPAV